MEESAGSLLHQPQYGGQLIPAIPMAAAVCSWAKCAFTVMALTFPGK